MKRKRKFRTDGSARPTKMRKTAEQGETRSPQSIPHPVLSQYYTRVLTLRDYLLSRLPPSSKRRRRMIGLLGKPQSHEKGAPIFQSYQSQSRYHDAAQLLDIVLVGVRDTSEKFDHGETEEATKGFEAFSQQLNATGSAAGRSQLDDQKVSLPEIVDFCIWLLFNRKYPSVHKPPHILCHGTLRASSTWHNTGVHAPCSIPGLVSMFPNEHVARLKHPAWSNVFELTGKGGDRVMLDLIISCGLFMPVATESGSYYQISGRSLSELQIIPAGEHEESVMKTAKPHENGTEAADTVLRPPSDVRLVRSRMFYARAALNAKRDVAFGLRHIHVFNRYPDAKNASHTGHIMKYIFPRQFGLHNIFTSKTDSKETSQPFHDYTLRETEIARTNMSRKVKGLAESSHGTARHLPKRLRGKAFELVRRLQVRHGRCSYTMLLAHYCPRPESIYSLPSTKNSVQDLEKYEQVPSFMSLATPLAQVSAFCRAVIARVFPRQLFGDGEETQTLLHRKIDAFIKARRFESLTLGTIMHGMKISDVDWLRPPNVDHHQKMSLSDFRKRQDVFAELIYYIFDSFLIPLVRSNFHVTESSAHRNRLFYFRHDVWRKLTEPALKELKVTLYHEIGGEKALKALEKRDLGFSQIRLLPKASGMRPITNLRRRTQVLQNGRKVLGRSINSILTPAFSVLNYEKTSQPTRLGASLFSIGGIYEKLRAYRQTLNTLGGRGQGLYFVKVDVKGCFDSIPQKRMMQLLQRVLSARDYKVSRKSEVRPAAFQDGEYAKPTRKFTTEVQVGEDWMPFDQVLEGQAKAGSRNTVFVDSVVPQHMTRTRVLQLLNEHVESNIVKIGKKFYRQRQGIPQGSVVSSLLCNFFYGDLEFNHLGFLSPKQSVLFRLIDDFLLITSDEAQARRFVETMHSGVPSYGVSVKTEKSLVNFDVKVGGRRVPRLPKGTKFPYCGMLIDSRSLDISKDRASFDNGGVSDSLTVEYSRRPGHNFRRKMLGALKMQMHTMLLDTSHNSRVTVLANLNQSLTEVAVKALHYMDCLKEQQQLSTSILIRTVQGLGELAFAMLRSKRNKERCAQYQCRLSKAITQWITVESFSSVFSRRRARLGKFVDWLDEQSAVLQRSCAHERELLGKAGARWGWSASLETRAKRAPQERRRATRPSR